ncbi:hypothetical protein ATO50_08345 [Aeromonas hydrophila]|nr:hypothetical protein ATO50_08345 [Aeromonas hydrophila]
MTYLIITTANLEYHPTQLLKMLPYGLNNYWIINLIIRFISLHTSPVKTLNDSQIEDIYHHAMIFLNKPVRCSVFFTP